MTSPPLSALGAPSPSSPRRINPWRRFTGSMIPNWLQRRREIGQGPKLAYARLAQHAGKGGRCFPKQETLAAELGVGERTVNEYIRILVKFGLIDVERPGLGRSNRYFFLDHPWIYEAQPESRSSSDQERQKLSASERKAVADREQQEASTPISKENQEEGESDIHTQQRSSEGLPHSLVEAVEIARQLGIDEGFARQEFHAKKAVGWKDGYGNAITSWTDHLQARWPIEQRKRKDRRAGAKRSPAPPRQFSAGDYKQSAKDF